MSAEAELEVLRAVQGSGLPVQRILTPLGIAKSTYYRWRQNFRCRGRPSLYDKPPARKRTWNKISPGERDKILETALLFPDWSPRQLSCHLTDNAGFTVSESTVYRILKSEGLIQEIQEKTFPAGVKYQIKTTGTNLQWQKAVTYLRVKHWGWYYLISVLDDFSRRILSWRLQSSITAGISVMLWKTPVNLLGVHPCRE